MKSRGEKKREKFETYPSSFEKFLLEFICRVLKGKLLASDVIDRWAVLQLQKEVIFKSDLFGVFLVLEMNVNRQLKPGISLLLYSVRGLGQHWNIWNRYRYIIPTRLIKVSNYYTTCTKPFMHLSKFKNTVSSEMFTFKVQNITYSYDNYCQMLIKL